MEDNALAVEVINLVKLISMAFAAEESNLRDALRLSVCRWAWRIRWISNRETLGQISISQVIGALDWIDAHC